MGHKTFAALHKMLDDGQSKVTVGGQYTHYKDAKKVYVITGLSILEANDSVAVKYARTDNPEVEFVRALDVWLETVEWQGQTVARFKKIN